MTSKIVFKNRSQFMSAQADKLKRLTKQISVTNTRVARYLRAQARMLAPSSSGKLINSIKIKNLKNGGRSVRLWATNTDGFPYPKWVNQDKGFTNLNYSKSNPVYKIKAGQTLIYGRSPAHWRWTGQAKFFTIAKERTNKLFPKVAPVDFNKALGARIG